MNDDARRPRPRNLMPTNLRLPTSTNIRPLSGALARPAAGPRPRHRAKCPPPPAWLVPGAADIWLALSKTLWAREEWHPEFLHAFGNLCTLQARYQANPNLSASLVAQLRLAQIEFGCTIRSRRARLTEQHGVT